MLDLTYNYVGEFLFEDWQEAYGFWESLDYSREKICYQGCGRWTCTREPYHEGAHIAFGATHHKYPYCVWFKTFILEDDKILQEMARAKGLM